MKEAGVEIFPYRSVLFYLLANRLNYRTYRKIIVIDGQTAFTGGIMQAINTLTTNQKNDIVGIRI